MVLSITRLATTPVPRHCLGTITDNNMRVIDYVNAYIDAGLHPIPLYYGSKKPIGTGWNENWDEIKCKDLFAQYPNANVGILLGDVVDVEGDTETANEIIDKLTKDVPHPKWMSAKSIHHLFKLPKHIKLTRRTKNNIEFRGNKHQSVVPPSLHVDGIRYRWIEDSVFPIPEMPVGLVEMLESLSSPQRIKTKKKEEVVFRPNHRSSVDPHLQYREKWLQWHYDVKKGHTKLWCAKCGDVCFLHKKRLHLESGVFKFLEIPWICNKCRTREFKEYIKKECRRNKKSKKNSQN